MGLNLNYKDILNELARNDKNVRQMTDEEHESLKDCLYEMSVDIEKRCRKNGIKLFLVGGSLLGAVRHGGFIPWDDDMDFGMKRSDYEKMKKVFDKEFSDAYELRCPNSDSPNGNRFMQIFKKGTVLRTIGDENPLQPSAAYVDIFPYDYVPENKIMRKIRGIKSNIEMFIASCVMDEKYMSKKTRKYYAQSKDGKLFFRIRRFVGNFFSFRSPVKWFNTVDNTIHYRRKTSLVTSATGRKHYFGEIYSTDTFFPLTEIKFKEHLFYAPGNYKRYLEGLYGNDYMVVPDKMHRECHFITELKL
ncbi:LicD family protein [Ruminococcus sp.]|uniref:LicD family protein n=1 Tax=Ruminococcus sp. TaxID=41978 RepID=UPI0025EE233B|nr:LicD family protein [Ruminococcus sp.]